MFLSKLDRKVVKNEKNQKKAIAFFSAGGHISETANNNIIFLTEINRNIYINVGFFSTFLP